MAERIPALTPRQSRAISEHEEKKRLAESAWHALLASDTTIPTWDRFAECSWDAAEAMYAESQRRRPVE